MHIGVENTLGLVHSLDTTAANVYDLLPSINLLHGEERQVSGDAGQSRHSKETIGSTSKGCFLVHRQAHGTPKGMDSDKIKAEKIKVSILSIMEHPFRYIRKVFRYSEVRYRVLAKTPTGCSCWQYSVIC